jgi:hypothetical protein
MPLVYLDTSHLSWLAQLRLKEPDRFEQFLSRWRAVSAELALSRVHLQELRRHRDDTTRETRYQLLSDLQPLRIENAPSDDVPAWYVSFHKRDALRALAARGIVALDTEFIDPPSLGFPWSVAGPGVAEILRTFEAKWFGVASERYYTATTYAARAEASRAGTRYQPSSPLNISIREAATAQFRAARLRFTAALQMEGWRRTYSVAEASLSTTFLLAIVPISIPAGLTVRVAFRWMTQLDNSKRDRAMSSDEAVARMTVRRWGRLVLRDLGSTNAQAREKARVLQVEDSWAAHTAFRVRNKLHRAKSPTPNDHFDLEHLEYLPYVDLLFADKRIREFGRQALMTGDASPEIRIFAARLCSAGSVAKLEEEIVRRFAKL